MVILKRKGGGFMGKSLKNATKEELFEMSLDFHERLMKIHAHQQGMENPQIILSYQGKEIKRIG